MNLFANSKAATICSAFTFPIPFISVKSFTVAVKMSFPNFFKVFSDNLFTLIPLTPLPNKIESSSELFKKFIFVFSNFSLGLSNSGKSLILKFLFIPLTRINFFITY